MFVHECLEIVPYLNMQASVIQKKCHNKSKCGSVLLHNPHNCFYVAFFHRPFAKLYATIVTDY